MLINYKQSRQHRRYEQRQKDKHLRQKEKAEAKVAIQIKNMIFSVLSQSNLDEIAKRTKFITRKRALSSTAIIAVLMLGCSGSQEISSLETISRYLKNWFNISMKPQSIQGRINKKEAAAFMKEVAMQVMTHEANTIIDKLLRKNKKSKSSNKLFRRILLQDSTVISLPESVARIFRGCGGSASKAAIKCDFIIDQTNHLIVKLKCTGGRIPDSSLSGDIIECLKDGDLVIRDLGYFNLNNFAKMIEKNIKFISRLSKNVHIYLTNNDEEENLDLIKYLEDIGISNQGIDIDVYVGKKARIPMRLIGIKVPQAILQMRKERYKKIRKKEASDELNEWNGYTMMLTNIQKKELNIKQILKTYKIRWQIELFFKNIKSYLHIDKFTGKNKYRILTLIYTKLILTWTASLLYAYAQMIVSEGNEISKFKFTKWLQEEISLKKAFITADFTELIEALRRDLEFLCTRRSKNQTSWIDEITCCKNNKTARKKRKIAA